MKGAAKVQWVTALLAMALTAGVAWGQAETGGGGAGGAASGAAPGGASGGAASGAVGAAGAGLPALPVDLSNPLTLLQQAGNSLPGYGGGSRGEGAGRLTTTGAATDRGVVGGSGGQADSRGMTAAMSIVILLTVLTVAPSILVMTTCFTRIIIVLSLLRQAMGTQSLPPSQVIVGLSLFLSLMVMAPTFERINREALTPLQENRIDQGTAWANAKQPLRDFMFDQIEHSGNWEDVYLMLNYRGIDTSQPEKLTRADVDMLALIPAFIISELKVAFLIGFRLYLPFLVIDMVISSVLISMGMMMLPPVLVSLPFKLLLFVLVDGWGLVAGNLLNSFAVPGVTT